jgi:hypothetical protein
LAKIETLPSGGRNKVRVEIWQSGSLLGIQQLLEKLLLMYCTADMSALGIMFNDWWCVKNNVFV